METHQINKFSDATKISTEIIDETQQKLPSYTYSINDLEELRSVNLNDQKMRWRDVYESLESDVAAEYDGLQAEDHSNKKKQKKKKEKEKETEKEKGSFADSKVADGMELDIVYERGSDDWILDGDPSGFCNIEVSLFVKDNGVQMDDKGLKVDALQESVCSVADVGEKIEVQRNVDGRMSRGEKVCGDGKGWNYSRCEMEALRFVNVEEQKMRWQDVYIKLSSDIVKELDGLQGATDQKQEQPQNGVGKQLARKKAGEILGIKTAEGPNLLNICDGMMNYSGKGIDSGELLDEYKNVDEDDSSSDEYGSIQRPAFLVEGEPDFDSGPPLDGFEYLRRVRWEAAQIPKVKVVKFNSSKLTSEQTAYMPSIPDIPKCPPELLPLKDWENAFLTEFSELRQAISNLEGNSSNEPSLNKESQSHGKQSNSIEQLKKNTPTLTAVLGMDAVSRAKALGTYVSSLESIDVLSKDDCLWLFSLCAAVDTPLHADTCAALRCLLRKCSHLLALKSEPDDEVAMLSVLIAITGKYFGQLDS